MATLIPSLNDCLRRMQNGEKRLAQRFSEKLEDDYIVWYNVAIGGQRRLYPDFVLLHPGRGLFVLEVKDWKLETLQAANPETVTLLTSHGVKQVKNPLEQARDYALAIKEKLEQDPQLVQTTERYQGKLACPYAYGVVFANITRKDFLSEPALHDVFPENLVLCRDEMYESVDVLAFQERLWSMSQYNFGTHLSQQQIDRIRWHLFPDLRINSHQLTLLEDAPPTVPVLPDLLRVMDLQQEQLARSLGEGHRIIHGVAGSGKTLILAYRCQHLAGELTEPILVLCFNVALATRLRQMMRSKGLHQQVQVRHFHGWCSDQIKQHQLNAFLAKQPVDKPYYEQAVQAVIAAVAAGKMPKGQYGAVLVDEGHDFQPSWLQLIAQMVTAQTQSLLVLYDDAQNIYEQKRQKKFSFSQVGIQARGRTTILKLNYRNTQEVITLAYEFAKEALPVEENLEADAPVTIAPLSAGRHGPMPNLMACTSFQQELRTISQQAQALQNQGVQWSDMAILYRDRWMAEEAAKHLAFHKIPCDWINRSTSSRHHDLGNNSLKLLTLHSSKGLEFAAVFIPGLGYMPHKNRDQAEDARLLYVGMTRAIDWLTLTYNRPSAFTTQLQAAHTTVQANVA